MFLQFWKCFSSVIHAKISRFNTTHRYIGKRYKKCIPWRFINWYIQNSLFHCEKIEQWDSRLLNQYVVLFKKIPKYLLCSVIWRWCLFHFHVHIHEQNDRYVLYISYSAWLRAERSMDRIPVGARYFEHDQKDPGTYPTSCTKGTGTFPWGKRQVLGADCRRGQEWVELNLYIQSRTSQSVIGRTLFYIHCASLQMEWHAGKFL
jgi:hypothetical protein